MRWVEFSRIRYDSEQAAEKRLVGNFSNFTICANLFHFMRCKFHFMGKPTERVNERGFKQRVVFVSGEEEGAVFLATPTAASTQEPGETHGTAQGEAWILFVEREARESERVVAEGVGVEMLVAMKVEEASAIFV